MKRISKVLAVVLALTMLVATSVLPASATDLENATLKLSYKNIAGDTITSATAGSMVDVYVSLKVDAFVTQMQYYLNYNSDYVMHNKYDSETESAANKRKAAKWLGAFGNADEFEIDETSEYYEFDQAHDKNEYYLNWGANTTEEVTLYNPDTMPTPPVSSTELIKVVYATNPGEQTLLVNTKGEYYEMLQFRFYVKEDIAKIDSSIFFFDPVTTTNIINIDTNNVPFANYTTAASTKSVNISYEYEGASTEPTAVLTNVQEPKVQWKADADGVLRLRFEGKLTGIVPTVGSDEKVTNIAKIGFKYSRDDATLANGTLVETKTLYDFTASEAGTYKFCAIVEVPMTADIISGATASNIHATAFITIGDNTSFASDPISTTIANEYTEGVTGGLTPFAA